MSENQQEQQAANTGGQFVKVEVIAQLFGLTVRRVQQLTQEGIIKTTEVPGQGRRYELVPTIKTYIQYLSDKAYGKSRSAKESELKEQKLEAEIALKESQGELHRMKREIAAGKYIDIDEVALDYQKFFIVFKRFALSIPSRLVSMVSDKITPIEGRQIEKELTEEIKRMLTAFVVAGSKPEVPKKERKAANGQT
jgi:phage terminase Nu1 subunit (DNA packaging protein)